MKTIQDIAHVLYPANPIQLVLFPIGINPDDNVLLKPGDFPGISFGKIAAIAAALNEKRDYAIKTGGVGHDIDLDDDDSDDLGPSPLALPGHNNRVLIIDAIDLAKHERNHPGKGRSFAKIMQNVLESSPGIERNRIGNSLQSQLVGISKVIYQKTGRFKLGVLKNYITVIDTQAPPGNLKIGVKDYPILHPAGSRKAINYGFSNSQRLQIAAAGMDGLPEDVLEPRASSQSLRVKASQANISLAKDGYGLISFSYINEKIYLFDYSQKEHLLKRAALREKIKKTATSGGSQTEAEKRGWENLIKMEAEANYHTLPVRGTTGGKPVVNPRDLTCE